MANGPRPGRAPAWRRPTLHRAPLPPPHRALAFAWHLAGTLALALSAVCCKRRTKKREPARVMDRGGLLVVASNGRANILFREQTFATSVIGGVSTSNLFGIPLVSGLAPGATQESDLTEPTVVSATRFPALLCHFFTSPASLR
jgi:hypothetical protein